MDTPVARPAIDGLHPVQFRPICLCHPTGDARSSFSAPFRPRSQWSGRHCSRRSGISKLERCSLTHSHLPRRRGALNTDQGSQFTSDDFTGTLKHHGITISMDGKGRFMDNIFVERLWRSLKYEEVYLKAYATVAEAKAGIAAWLDFYNTERLHQSLGYRTPRQIYEDGLWICGRSASPTGCASPASPASLESGEMLAVAHIPTGTTASNGINIDRVEDKTVITEIGADIETGGATP